MMTTTEVEKMTGLYCEWVYSSVAELRKSFRRFHRGQLHAKRAMESNGWQQEMISLEDLRWSFGTESCWIEDENRYAEISDLEISNQFCCFDDSPIGRFVFAYVSLDCTTFYVFECGAAL